MTLPNPSDPEIISVFVDGWIAFAKVRSRTRDLEYNVIYNMNDGRGTCGCEHHTYRNSICQHIAALKNYLARNGFSPPSQAASQNSPQ